MTLTLVTDFATVATVVARREPPLTPLAPERAVDAVNDTSFRAWRRALQKTPKEKTMAKPTTTTKQGTKITMRQHDRNVLAAFEALLDAIDEHPVLGSPTIRDEVPCVLPAVFGLVSNGYGSSEYPGLPRADRLHALLFDSLDNLFYLYGGKAPTRAGEVSLPRAKELIRIAAAKQSESEAGEAWRAARAAAA